MHALVLCALLAGNRRLRRVLPEMPSVPRKPQGLVFDHLLDDNNNNDNNEP